MSDYELFEMQRQVAGFCAARMRIEATLPDARLRHSIHPFLFGAVTMLLIVVVGFPLGVWLGQFLP